MESKEQLQFLVENYATASKEQLLAMFPDRDWYSLRNRANKLRERGIPIPYRNMQISNKTEKLYAYVRNNYGKKTYAQMCQETGKSMSYLGEIATRLRRRGENIPKQPRQPEDPITAAAHSADRGKHIHTHRRILSDAIMLLREELADAKQTNPQQTK